MITMSGFETGFGRSEIRISEIALDDGMEGKEINRFVQNELILWR